MKKRSIVGIFILIVLILSILSISFVSAGWFDDFWNKVTGRVVAENSLVAQYKFENNLDDSSGNGNNGAISSGSANYVDGKAGKAISFTGSNYVTIADNPSIQAQRPMSVEAWVKRDEVGEGDIIANKRGDSNKGWGFSILSTDKLRFTFFGIKDIDSSKTIIDTNWHHVAATVDSSGNVKLYIDGGDAGSLLVSKAPLTTSSPLRFGASVNSDGTIRSYPDLAVDEIKIWNYGLTEAQVTEEYNSYKTTPIEPTCTDSDSGKDYYVKGTLISELEGLSEEDVCVNELGSNPASAGPRVMEWYCQAVNDGAAVTYECPYGCSDGACKSAPINVTTNVTNVTTCTDSDGGKNYYVKGSILNPNDPSLAPVYDHCINDTLFELYCNNNVVSVADGFNCPNGCSDGACIKNPVCQDLINKVKNPSDFVDSGIGYSLNWNSTYEGDTWIDGQPYKFTEHYASWNTNYNEKYNQISYDILVFDDTNIDLQAWLKERTNYEVCVLRTYWSEDNKEDKVYICNWDILNQQQNLDNYKSKSRDILWTNDNVVVQIYVYSGDSLTDEEVSKIAEKRLNDFLNDLKDNQGKYVGWENFDIDWPLSNQIAKSLSQCSSEIPVGTCEPNWNCKIEPVICPEYGYQTKTCVDYYCNKEKIESKNYCSPGVCSGCYVPRWFDIDRMNLDNTCIPYGFRFNHQIGWNYKLEEFTEEERIAEKTYEGEFSLVILSEEEATLTLYDREGVPYEYTLTPGASVEINIPNWETNIEKMTLTVKDIVYQGPGGENYVDVTVKALGWRQEADTMNAYCDYDGEIKMQKPDWQDCQNSYECESNLCSGRECTGINQMLREVNAFKSLGVKILCKLADMFNLQDYESCVFEYLGPPESTSEPSS